MTSLEILNPVAEVIRVKIAPAPRVGTLAGKTVGLFWNNKPGGDVALAAVAEELAKRYPQMSFRNYLASVGSSTRYATAEDIAKIVAECDAVIGTSAD